MKDKEGIFKFAYYTCSSTYIKNPSIILNMHLFPGEKKTDVTYIVKKKKKKIVLEGTQILCQRDKYKNQYRIATAHAGMEWKLV